MMISPQELRRIARERGLALDLVEKDYVLGWLLYGVASSTLSSRLAFKGGTALSKVYFPGQWRLSEDLDFTFLDSGDDKIERTELSAIAKTLSEEIPDLIGKASGISVTMKKVPFSNPGYLQSRFQYSGPISKNTVKVEISKEKFVGEIFRKGVPRMFDYPKFDVKVYSPENILAEKIRTLLERGKLKDYYDVWRLLRVEKFQSSSVRNVFLEKCRSKNIAFNSLDQIFPADLEESLRRYMKIGLARLSLEPVPPLKNMIDELRQQLRVILVT